MYAVSRQHRIGSGIAALLVAAAIGWALLVGLAGGVVRRQVDEGLALFRLSEPPPPPRPRIVPARRVSERASGRAAPRNIRSQATEVAAPVPVVVVPLPPPPIVVALKPFAGNEATQGAAPTPGPGTGAGGIGDGTGAGGWGDGDGGGYGDETPPRWLRGRLRDSDYPRGIGEQGVQGLVSVRFLVGTDGRVTECTVTQSSGSPVLDSTTCRLIQQRFRYAPSRDARGRPVPAYILENHEWVIEDAPEEP